MAFVRALGGTELGRSSVPCSASTSMKASAAGDGSGRVKAASSRSTGGSGRRACPANRWRDHVPGTSACRAPRRRVPPPCRCSGCGPPPGSEPRHRARFVHHQAQADLPCVEHPGPVGEFSQRDDVRVAREQRVVTGQHDQEFLVPRVLSRPPGTGPEVRQPRPHHLGLLPRRAARRACTPQVVPAPEGALGARP